MPSNRLPLADRTRRRLCRALFLIVCLLPTVSVTAWIISSRAPSNRSAIESRWSQSLGLRVQLDAIDYPRPGIMRLTGFEINDPESGAVIASIPELEIDSRGNEKLAKAKRLSVDKKRLPSAWRAIEQKFRWGAKHSWRFQLEQVELLGREQSLASVEASWSPLEHGSQAALAFRIAGGKQDKPFQIRFARQRKQNTTTQRFELNARPAPLPCSWLADFGAPSDRLGPGAWFSGYVWANRVTSDFRQGDWEAEITGELGGLQLESLLNQEAASASASTSSNALLPKSPNVSNGKAHVWIDRARIANGRLENATIALTAGPGRIDAVPLNRWISELRLQTLVQRPERGTVPFDQIALRLTLASDGAILHGACANMPERTLLTTSRKPILLAPHSNRLPLSSVVRAISPRGQEFVPTTDTAQRLSLWLPESGPFAAEPKSTAASVRDPSERISSAPKNILRTRP